MTRRPEDPAAERQPRLRRLVHWLLAERNSIAHVPRLMNTTASRAQRGQRGSAAPASRAARAARSEAKPSEAWQARLRRALGQ